MEETIAKLEKRIRDLEIAQSRQTEGVTYGIDFGNLTGLVEVVTTAPTHFPRNVYEQIKIHYNSTGPVVRLYIYDNVNSKWNYTTLTQV